MGTATRNEPIFQAGVVRLEVLNASIDGNVELISKDKLPPIQRVIRSAARRTIKQKITTVNTTQKHLANHHAVLLELITNAFWPVELRSERG